MKNETWVVGYEGWNYATYRKIEATPLVAKRPDVKIAHPNEDRLTSFRNKCPKFNKWVNIKELRAIPPNKLHIYFPCGCSCWASDLDNFSYIALMRYMYKLEPKELK